MQTDYHSELLDASSFSDYMRKAATAIKNLKRRKNKNLFPEAIAVTGVSGLVAGGAVSLLTGLPLCIIRKSKKCHSSFTVEGPEVNRYLILDDFVETGNTIKNIIKKMKAEMCVPDASLPPTCCGVMFWHPYVIHYSSRWHIHNVRLVRGLPIYTPNVSGYPQAEFVGCQLRGAD